MTAVFPHRPGSLHPHWRYTLRQFAWAGIDLLFPPRCGGGCGREGQRFCPQCAAEIERIPPPICEHCGYPVRQPEVRRCLVCRSLTTPALSGIRSYAIFSGPLQHALHRLKYRRDIILADSLALYLYVAWQRHHLPPGLVVPVPLSEARARERGYNQAGLLARGFAELARLPSAPRAVRRTRHTASQVKLTAQQRQANVAGAFSADRQAVAGQPVILVDDVCTTGATLAACAEALQRAGATEVWGLTLARARSPAHHAASTRLDRLYSVHRRSA